MVLGSGLLGLVLSRRGVLDRAGVQDPGQPEVVALLLLLATLGSLLASPVGNTASRPYSPAEAPSSSRRAVGLQILRMWTSM